MKKKINHPEILSLRTRKLQIFYFDNPSLFMLHLVVRVVTVSKFEP